MPNYTGEKTLTANKKDNGSKTHKLPEKQSTICQIKTKPIFFTKINKVGLRETKTVPQQLKKQPKKRGMPS